MGHQNSSAVDTDAEQLAKLGYTSEFKREMNLWENFALGFTYLSPVVGIYTLFSSSLELAGPPMIWALLLAGCGQFLVALIFGEIVSQYPLAGGVYPWARRLWGRKWAWMTGWVYTMALFATIGGVSYGAAPYTAMLIGFEPSTGNTVIFALLLLLVATAINMMGTRVLARAAMIGFIAEIIGALVVGGYLLLFERKHDFSVLFDTFDANLDGSYLSAFLAASLIGVYQYYGFEACGDVAEEVPNPGKGIPKAMRRTVYIGGIAATFVCLALIMSVVDFRAVIEGRADGDTITTILVNAFGPVGGWMVIGVILISFLSCAMSLQAAASRMIYAYARDKMIFASGLLSQFSSQRHVPPYALLLAAVVPGIIVLSALISTDALVKIVSFAALGIYIAFQMVVLAALRARLKGWHPAGQFKLGRWGLLINIAALTYGIAAIINISWPRTPDAPWYDNYIVLLSTAIVIGIGLIYLITHRPHHRSRAAHGDAIPVYR